MLIAEDQALRQALASSKLQAEASELSEAKRNKALADAMLIAEDHGLSAKLHKARGFCLSKANAD